MLNKTIGLIVLIFALILSTSCKKDFTSIGNQLIDTPNFKGELYEDAHVRIYDKAVDSVLSSNLKPNSDYNNLPYASLGFYNDEKFGLLKADIATIIKPDADVFDEDLGDNIEILASKLIIPYFSHIEDEAYVLDSVYGESTLDIKVYELTYLLPTYDPSSNLEERRKYYSNFDFSAYKGDVIGEADDFQVSNEPYYNYKRNDDGTFELDDNGEKIVSDSLSPRLVIDLNNDYFQQKIFDHSGEDVLANYDMFLDYFRGLYIEALNSGETDRFLMMPLEDAEILIEYTYEEIDDNGTPNDTGDDTVEVKYKEIKMPFGMPQVNHYENSLTPEAQQALNNSDLINGDENVFIKGEAGSEAVIQLFDEQQLRELRESDWMINQADLYVYVNNDESDLMPSNPPRLLIYNYESKDFLYDITYDENVDNNCRALNGFLQTDDDGSTYYKFGITRHIRDVIKNDSLNAPLALRVITEDMPVRIKKADMFIDPDAFVPSGTVIYGNESAVKPPVLKIYYTDPE